MRQIFFSSILLAAVCSGPLAAAAVLLHWTSAGPGTLLSDGLSPALWSARKFLAYFDLSMLVTFVPCAAWISRVSERLQMRLLIADPD